MHDPETGLRCIQSFLAYLFNLIHYGLCFSGDVPLCTLNSSDRRVGGNWGIALGEDYFSLQWQRCDFRKWRAQRAIGQDKIRVYRYSNDGPLTLNMFGVQIPGWETDSTVKAKQADFDRMQETRMKAHNACKKLKKMSESYNVKHELTSLDWREAEAESMGYY